jgi:mono/diheme cytochrome c family protein
VAFTSGNVSPTAFGSIGRPSVVVMALPRGPASTTTFNAPDATRGKQLFQQICAGCHGPEGDKVSGKELKAAAKRLDQDKVAAFILNPVAPMPKIFPDPRSVDDERDVRDVAAFVASWSH